MNLMPSARYSVVASLSAVCTGLVLLCRAPGAVAQVSTEPPAPVFTSAKEPGEVAVLDVKAPYCWGVESYRLEYTAHPSPRVTVWVSWYYDKDKRTKFESGPLRRLGTVTLTAAQADRLDERIRQIRAFRAVDDRDDDTATFTLTRNGIKTYTESFNNFPISIGLLEDSFVEDVKAIPDSPYKHLWFSGTRSVLALRRLEDIAEQAGKQKNPLPYRDLPREETIAWQTIHYEEIIKKADAKRDREMHEILSGLAGREVIERLFLIERQRRVSYTTYGDNITVLMQAKGERVVDRVLWYDLIEKGKAAQDWQDVLRAVDALEAYTRRIPWLARWKAGNRERSVATTVMKANQADTEEWKDEVFPAWRHAGLRGNPEFRLDLCNSYGSITVYGNFREDRLLLTSVHPADKPDPRFWFDGLELNYKPTQKMPQYAVINADGTGKRNTRSDVRRASWYARRNDTTVEE